MSGNAISSSGSGSSMCVREPDQHSLSLASVRWPRLACTHTRSVHVHEAHTVCCVAAFFFCSSHAASQRGCLGLSHSFSFSNSTTRQTFQSFLPFQFTIRALKCVLGPGSQLFFLQTGVLFALQPCGRHGRSTITPFSARPIRSGTHTSGNVIHSQHTSRAVIILCHRA